LIHQNVLCGKKFPLFFNLDLCADFGKPVFIESSSSYCNIIMSEGGSRLFPFNRAGHLANHLLDDFRKSFDG